jgi:hypothetical protein
MILRSECGLGLRRAQEALIVLEGVDFERSLGHQPSRDGGTSNHDTLVVVSRDGICQGGQRKHDRENNNAR